MQLPATLEQTTLGDLLGTLHRGRAFGVLELVEGGGRRHEVQLWDGLVVEVRLGAARRPLLGQVLCRRVADPFLPAAIARAILRRGDGRALGERLIAVGIVSRRQVNDALLDLYCERLSWLERLTQASVRFRPLGARARADLLLGPELFLFGRARRRRSEAPTPRATRAPQERLASDYAVLGLPLGAPWRDVQRAFRAAVRTHHPDLYVHLGEEVSRRAHTRFRVVVESYERLRGALTACHAA
jgi:hypothetical protein